MQKKTPYWSLFLEKSYLCLDNAWSGLLLVLDNLATLVLSRDRRSHVRKSSSISILVIDKIGSVDELICSPLDPS